MADDFGPGSAEESFAYLRGDYVTGFETYDFGEFGVATNLSLGPGAATINAIVAAAQASAAAYMGSLPGGEPGEPPSGGDKEDHGIESVVPIFDPSTAPQATVFEKEPGAVRPGVEFEDVPNPYQETADTDWEAVYREYVILNEPEPEEPVIDWGDVIGGALGSIATGLGAPTPHVPFVGPGFGGAGATATVPAKVTVDTATGRVTACRRRRRRKLLTESDFSALLRISTLPNKDIVKIALAKAIG